MRRCSFLVHISLLLLADHSYGQFGHEWINYSQTYYKVSVIKNGIHRLTYDDLSTAGVPVNSIDPRRIQIFRRGEEQTIHFNNLEAPADGQFEPGEYLEFYGEKNDGATDVDLYKNQAHHPHPYYNLYSDTAAYFLSWNLLPVQGKRMATITPEVNVGNLPAEPGFSNSVNQVFVSNYSGGLTYAGLIQSSFFDEGEGWTGSIICTLSSGCTGQQDFILNVPNYVSSSIAPQLEILLVGRAALGHMAEIYAGNNASSLRLVETRSFQNFQSVKITVPLLVSDMATDGTITIRVKGLGVSGVRESLSVSYINLNYQRNFNVSGSNAQVIQLNPNTLNKSYLEIQNPVSGLRLFDITNTTSGSVIGTFLTGTKLTTVISGTVSSKKLFATAEFFTPKIKKISFQPINPASYNYLIVSNVVLRKGALGYADPVAAYSDYRASEIGGGYSSLLVNIDQLYNQFNYGETSPRAIYQFLKFMANGGNPKYLFLIGKGLEITLAYNRSAPNGLQDLVPAAGLPGSDLIYSSGLRGASYVPAIPTGRLTATSAAEVAAYLNKIKETELLPYDNLWRKEILHLSGGINPGEPQLFKAYVDGFKSIAEDLYLGGDVDTKSKRTLNVDETVPIAEQINSGLALVTFFGHSSTSTLDFDIGYVSNPVLNYNNPGKYPALLINGCNVGRVYSNGKNFGEDWILAQNKGAKAFIAHSSFGLETSLRLYTDLFYRKAFADSILLTKGVGDVQKEVVASFLAFSGISTNSLSVVYQMILLGDPAVKIFGAPKPDYAIEDDFLNKISLDGKPITTATSSFAIQYKIRNYGQVRKDSIRIFLTRTFPNNSTITYDTLVPQVFNEKEFMFIVPNPQSLGGQNTFTIEIDKTNKLVENNESNNKASLNIFIPGSSTFNLVPYQHAIVNTTAVELIFQNTNQLPSHREYLLELDTVPTFNSPFLLQRKILANVLGRASVSIAPKDSTAYYWRTKLFQPTANESADWFITSFSYIANGIPGWVQLSNPQYSENTFSGLIQNPNGTSRFPERVSTVVIQNFGSANPTPYTSTSVKVNNEELNLTTQGQWCRANTLNMLTFDKITGTVYPSIPFGFLDGRTCGREPQVINSFTMEEAEATTNGLAQAIANIAPNDSVVFFTIGNAGIETYSTTLLATLGEVGLSPTQLVAFGEGEPLIFFGRKGAAPGKAKVIRSTTSPVNQQELAATGTITSRAQNGHMISNWIGPAKEWFYLTFQPGQVQASDKVTIKITGLSMSNKEVVLHEGNRAFVNLAFIDPAVYPKIKLQINSEDPINLTPVDFKNWLVTYSPVAEGILLLRGSPQSVMRQEGDPWSSQYSFINLSQQDFVFKGAGESRSVDFKILNQDKGVLNTKRTTMASPMPRDSIRIDWKVETIGQVGVNDMTVQVATDAYEQYTFNNQLSVKKLLVVVPDRQPPAMDVTVDGRYLMNGDVVSSTPTIKIKLMDENVFRYKTDTLGIQISIQDLDTEVSRRVNFSDPKLSWSPASPTSDFNISFQTELAVGEYKLSIQGMDASGNLSGDAPYTVLFSVSTDLSLVIGDPFPNPSASIFTFPIRLSGNELPESMSLKIISPDGRLLRHYGLDDVSGFYVGTNYLKWNPHHSDGVTLPDGLYYFKWELTVSGKGFCKSGRLVFIKK